MEPSKKTISDLLTELGVDLKTLTISQIAEQTKKSERVIRAHLTRNGITVKDYDGEGNRAQAIKNQEAVANKLKSESSPANKKSVSPSETYQSIERGADESFKSMAVIFGLIWIVITIWGFSENGAGFFLFWLLISVCLVGGWGITSASLAEKDESRKIASLSPKERETYKTLKSSIDRSQNERMAVRMHESQYGSKNPNLICPHCQTKGDVRNKLAEEVTTTKVVPIIGNNIRTKKQITQMHCDNCQTTWNI